MRQHDFDIILTKEIPHGEAGVAAEEIAGGWELVEIYRDGEIVEREARGHSIYLDYSELAALPPVAAALDALRLAQDFVDAEYYDGEPGDPRPRYGDYEALDNVNDAIRAALAQFAEPEREQEGE